MIKKSCEIMQLSNKIILSIMFYLLTFLNAKEWVDTGSQLPSNPVWNLEENSEGNIEIIFEFGGYFLSQLESGQNQITFPEGVPILDAGSPELPRMARSIIIPDLAHMELSVLESDFVEIEINNVMPSKGNLTRDIDPSTVPFTYGAPYKKDAWYPEQLAFLRDPYILRSFRGQAVVFQPIQYNPIKRLLRVYTHIKISIQEMGLSQINTLSIR